MAQEERTPVLVIGHRGAAALAAENTLAGVDKALDAGADGIEIDLRLSSDGTLVVIHDASVLRTTTREGLVADMSADALASLGVPSFEQILARVPPEAILITEIKSNPWEHGYDSAEPVAYALADALASEPVADPRRKIVVSCFNPAALAVVRDGAPGARTAILTSAGFDLDSNLIAALEGGHEECHVPAQILEPGFVERAHAAGRAVVAWTVNEPGRLRAFRGWGVDGVITDDPAAARAALAL